MLNSFKANCSSCVSFGQGKTRDVYQPLSFQNILRNYESINRPLQKYNSQQKHVQKLSSVKQSNGENKSVVDLSKKMKIVRSQKEEFNKENMQQYANCCADNTTQKSTSKLQNILSIEHSSSQREQKCINVQQFCCGQQNKIQIEQSEQKIGNLHQEKAKGILDLIQPIIQQYMQSQKCQWMLENQTIQQDNSDNIRQIELENKLGTHYEENAELIAKQLNKIPQQEVLVLKETPVQTQKVQNIKTKLSLRILKRKLKEHSLDWVVKDVIKHRRIQLEGSNQQPEGQAIIQALISFMKHQLIQ